MKPFVLLALGLGGYADDGPPPLPGPPLVRSAAQDIDPYQAFIEGLKGLAEQIDALRRGLEDLPRSEEAERLKEEWRRILGEIANAQSQTEKALREDLLPRLQEELKRLEERLEALRPKERPKSSPIWI